MQTLWMATTTCDGCGRKECRLAPTNSAPAGRAPVGWAERNSWPGMAGVELRMPDSTTYGDFCPKCIRRPLGELLQRVAQRHARALAERGICRTGDDREAARLIASGIIPPAGY